MANAIGVKNMSGGKLHLGALAMRDGQFLSYKNISPYLNDHIKWCLERGYLIEVFEEESPPSVMQLYKVPVEVVTAVEDIQQNTDVSELINLPVKDISLSLRSLNNKALAEAVLEAEKQGKNRAGVIRVCEEIIGAVGG